MDYDFWNFFDKTVFPLHELLHERLYQPPPQVCISSSQTALIFNCTLVGTDLAQLLDASLPSPQDVTNKEDKTETKQKKND